MLTEYSRTPHVLLHDAFSVLLIYSYNFLQMGTSLYKIERLFVNASNVIIKTAGL